jgi:hypothetical protein
VGFWSTSRSSRVLGSPRAFCTGEEILSRSGFDLRTIQSVASHTDWAIPAHYYERDDRIIGVRFMIEKYFVYSRVTNHQPKQLFVQRVSWTVSLDINPLVQRFPNLFQVGTTFISQNVLRTTFISKNVLRTTVISQNVLRTTLLLSPLKANCLRFSTTVCDTNFTLIWFFLFFGLMFNLRGPQEQNPRTTCGSRTTVW